MDLKIIIFLNILLYLLNLSLSTFLFLSLFLITSIAYLLYTQQSKMLYLPHAASPYIYPNDNPETYRNPLERSMSYEDIYIKTKDDEELHGWFIKNQNHNNCPTIIYFHANAGNMGLRMDIIQLFYRALKCNIFIISYRGYGNSSGIPNEEGLIMDAQAAMEYIISRNDIDQSKLFTFGQSLGGAVAISLISGKYGHLLKGAILENTFTSISDMVNTLFPMLAPLKSLVLRLNWPSVDRIANTKCPVLFISGRVDELVPSSHMDKLYISAAKSNPSLYLKFLEIENGSHNDTIVRNSKVCVSEMFEFIEQCCQNKNYL